jgi:GxxExxY protein
MVDDLGVAPELTHRILGCAIEVHRALGPGLLENAYRACLLHCLKREGLQTATETPIPIRFDGVCLDVSYRADIIVERKVLLELKVVDRLQPVHAMQVLTYLRLSGIPVGLLINFNVETLMSGVKRLVCRPRTSVLDA